MRKLSKTQNLVFRLGAVMMLLGAATYQFGNWVSNALFVLGVLMFVAMQLRTVYEGRNIVVVRLRRQQLIGAAVLVMAAAAMTWQTMGHNFYRYNEWVVCVLVGAVLEFYTALRIPQELEKEQQEKEK